MADELTFADGSTGTRPELDWLPRYDPRNEMFPFASALSEEEQTEPLTSGMSKTWPLEARLDQGRQGACVGFAWTHELAAEPTGWRYAPKFPDGDLTEPAAGELFAKLVYWDAQRRDIWPGGEYPRASPRMLGTSLLAGAKVLQMAGYIRQYRWAFTVEDIARAIAYSGPVVFGTRWFEGMDRPDPDTGAITVDGSPVGGHALAVTGVDVAAEQFYLVNSWGVEWGEHGACRLGFEDMEKLLAMRGEACVPVGRKTPGGDIR